MKKVLAVILSLVLLASAFALSASASTGKTREVKMLCYNVAGLPSISGVMGMQGTNVAANQKKLGQLLNATDYDVIAVQEDFGYHYNLVGGLKNYPYKTNHTGGVPGGDGMNVFSKTPIYNEKRTTWESAYGVVNDGADEMTPKGILYTVVEIGDGIYADLYDIHADAFEDQGSTDARNDNFRQLAKLIRSKKTNRPVIVTGDFNTSAHRENGAALVKYLIEQVGLKDAWTELYNDGNYYDYSSCPAKYGEQSAGVWDSIEKFLYMDGGGVHLEVKDFAYVDFVNDDGVSISDHKAASATFRFTKTNKFVKNRERLYVPAPDPVGVYRNAVYTTYVDAIKLRLHIGDVLSLLFS